MTSNKKLVTTVKFTVFVLSAFLLVAAAPYRAHATLAFSCKK